MASVHSTAAAGTSPPMTAEEKRVIFASSLGTIFEWYDFYLFGVMAAIIGANFFAPLDEKTRVILTLLAFAAGFAVRPFGALVFGRLGDMIGRKYTFLRWVDPMIVSTSTCLTAALLVIAWVYQFSPLKRACLSRCRTPPGFLLGEWRPGAYGAFAMGARHGLFCLGCCWALMALLFVGGMMNLTWIAALSIAVAIEKLLPGGERLSYGLGIALIAVGLVKWTAGVM